MLRANLCRSVLRNFVLVGASRVLVVAAFVGNLASCGFGLDIASADVGAIQRCDGLVKNTRVDSNKSVPMANVNVPELVFGHAGVGQYLQEVFGGCAVALPSADEDFGHVAVDLTFFSSAGTLPAGGTLSVSVLLAAARRAPLGVLIGETGRRHAVALFFATPILVGGALALAARSIRAFVNVADFVTNTVFFVLS